jgi:protoheme IX farnesyltransferase
MTVKTATATLPADEARGGLAAFFRDLGQLAKPRITGMVVFTFGAGLWLAPGALGATRALIALLGTTLIVAGANAVNQYLERDVDGLMRRTAARPLPEGRLVPTVALAFGGMMASAAIPIMLVGGGFLMAALGLLAFYAYVWGYTPLKRRTPAALYVGALPGALPPLMGWVAVTGRVDVTGLALFAILFLWQIPHFTAIATYRDDEYTRAGFKVMALGRSPALTRATVMVSTAALVVVSLALAPLGLAGRVYLAAAATLGLGFLVLAARVLRVAPGTPEAGRWARSLFFYSLLYLTALFLALGIDRSVG